MGRHLDSRLANQSYLGYAVNWQQPIEDPDDGCPGAWYRVPWVDDLFAYLRRRTKDGNRVSNPRFDSAPWQIQEAVMYFEIEEERRINHEITVANERAAAKAAKDKKRHLPVMQSPRRRR